MSIPVALLAWVVWTTKPTTSRHLYRVRNNGSRSAKAERDFFCRSYSTAKKLDNILERYKLECLFNIRQKRLIMFDYLYYKIYQAVLKGSLRDIPRFATSVYCAGLISVNLLVINAFLAKIDIIPFLFPNKMAVTVLVVILIIGALIYYYWGGKSNDILKKYSQESKPERIRGNVIVWVYVILSFLLIFAIGLFRPGKL